MDAGADSEEKTRRDNVPTKSHEAPQFKMEQETPQDAAAVREAHERVKQGTKVLNEQEIEELDTGFVNMDPQEIVKDTEMFGRWTEREVRLGDGDVGDAIEFALHHAELRPGLRLRIWCSDESGWGNEDGVEKIEIGRDGVFLVVSHFEDDGFGGEGQYVSPVQTLAHATLAKNQGNKMLKSNRHSLALLRYEIGITAAKRIHGMVKATDDERDEAKSLVIASLSNSAICASALATKEYNAFTPATVIDLWGRVRALCTEALELDTGHEKCMYRLALAEEQLGFLSDAIQRARRVVELNPSNAAARELYTRAKEKKKQAANKSKKALEGMVKKGVQGGALEVKEEPKPKTEEADDDMKKYAGMSPYQIARAQGNAEMVEVFEEHFDKERKEKEARHAERRARGVDSDTDEDDFWEQEKLRRR